MKKMGIFGAAGIAISMLLVGLGFWTLTKIEPSDPFDIEFDDGCCNGGATDCVC